MTDPVTAETTSAPLLIIPEALASEAAGALLSGNPDALPAVREKMAAALSGQGLPATAAGALAEGWMHDFANGLGAQSTPDAAILQANRIAAGAAERMVQATQNAASLSGEQKVAIALAQGQGMDAQSLPTPEAAARLSAALFSGVMDPLARPAGAADPIAALSQALNAPAVPTTAPAAAPLSPAEQLTAALASGAGVQDAVKALGAGQNGHFADTLERALSSGTESTAAVTAAREASASSELLTHSTTVVQSDGDRMLTALASGGAEAQGAVSGPAFASVLNDALARGGSPDAALGASVRAQAEMTASQTAAAVPPKPTDALVASLASGRNVAETVKSFATAAGFDGTAAGGFGQALGGALSTGHEPSGALGTARQDVAAATALSAETTKGVKADPLVAALASGNNVQQAVQALGGTGTAFGAALGQALAEGRSAGQALAAARQAADTVQQNSQSSEVPVSAQDKAMADLANPDKAAAAKETGESKQAAKDGAQHSESTDGKAVEQVADAQAKDAQAKDPQAKDDGGKEKDGKENAKSDDKGDTKGDAKESSGEKAAADASADGKPPAPDASSPPAAKSATGETALKSISFDLSGTVDKGATGDSSAHSTASTDARPAVSAPSVTKALSTGDAFAVAAQSQQRAVQSAVRAIENATTDSAGTSSPTITPTLPATPTVTVEHHAAAPTLSPSFDAAALAKALAIAEGTTAPAGFTVFHLIEAMFRPGETGSSVVGVAVVANQGSQLGVWQYSVDGSSWIAVGSVAETAALVLPGNALLRFLPATGASGQAPALELRAVGDEWTGGFSGAEHRLFTLAGTGGTTPLSSDVAQLSLAITPVNGAPVATGVQAVLDSVTEDSTNPVGASVSTLFGKLFSDPSDAVFGVSGDKFAGVAVVANPGNAAQGEWQYWNGSSWVAIGAASDGNALLLSAETMLRFLPVTNWNGQPPSLMVRLVDESAGAIVSGDHVDLKSLGVGGTTPYSVSAILLDSRVTAVNDAPVATGTAATLAPVAEDSADPAGMTVSTLFGGLFSDPIDAVAGGSTANAFAGVLVVGNAATAAEGAWQYWTGSAWTDIGAAGAGNGLLLAAGTMIRFLPAADWNGATPALTVRLVDDSLGAIISGERVTSTMGGGTSRYSADTVTLAGSVDAVNDAPVATGTAATLPAIAEDTADPAGATVTSLFGSLFSDAADAVAGGSTADGFAGIAIVGNAATTAQGVWQYWTGTAWAAVGSVSEGSALVIAAADRLRFVPSADWNGTTPALTVRLIEEGGGSTLIGSHVDLTQGVGGSTVYSADTIVLTGSVTPVNDAPQVTAGTTSLSTVKGVAVAVTGLSVSDIDAGSAPMLITLSAGHGTLTLADGGTDAVITGNGTDTVTVRATLATINSLLGATNGLLYTASSYTGADTVHILVDDQGNGGDGGPLTASASVAVTVVPPNASPVLADTSLTLSVAAEALAAPTAGTAGIAVSKLVGLNGTGPANVTDGDAGAVTGIALVGTNESYGHWWFSTDGGSTWSLVGTVNDSDSALLLRPTDRLYFQPNASVPATVNAALTIHAWDQTSGTAGTKVAMDTSTGSAFSSATDSVTLHPGVLVPNGSFDNGLSGWTYTGGTSIGSTGDGHEATLTSAVGQTPTQLEDFLGLTHGSIAAATGTVPSAGHAMKLGTTVTVTQDTTLTFDWSFTFSDPGYHDFAFVSVNGVVTLLAKDASASGSFSVVVSANSTLSLGFGTSDTTDNSVNPILRVDNIKLTTVASDPIVLDMTGNGLALRPLSDGIHFDVTGDGIADSTGWIGPGNALLVQDSNGNGRIDDAHELVSEQFGSGFNSSLDALASLDRNHDGRLDATDETFATLKVWQDANSDGMSQANELLGLTEAGIRAIATTASPSDAALAGSRILGTTSMTMADGSSHMVAGVAFDVKASSAAQVQIQPQAAPAVTNFAALLTSGLGLPAEGAIAPQDALSHFSDSVAAPHLFDQHHQQNSDASNVQHITHA
ncbi:hypothetical protein J2848_002816 [Azospirillum lipoferum]|uniref:beta strand repeat-containing protein n=1 Tax=Azospirillum TaxID=191 RepID=UPI001B3BE1C9|nr:MULTISPECIES: hypothetical protein [Azospirillum]MCP1611143.1 hypothetical protein [Azospirillum lipoferum]MDW5533732.1 hypothetical protein [Azospirillum sp. NL1]